MAPATQVIGAKMASAEQPVNTVNHPPPLLVCCHTNPVLTETNYCMFIIMTISKDQDHFVTKDL